MSMRVAITGVSGRMGRALLEAVDAETDCVLGAAIDRPGGALVGQDAGAAWGAASGVRVTDEAGALAGAHALIDFTRPEATFGYLDACVAAGVPLVIGTTGFDQAGKARIAAAAERIPVVFAPNMSAGVNLLMKLAEVAARVLQDGYDIEIIEAHHRHKVDAPSGTALGLGQAVAHAIDRDLASCAVYGREGVTGERDPGTIGFATVRGGDIVGDHTLLFAGIGERVELTHKASSRATFARGALRAARWLQGRAPGLYDMRDVLDLK
ncbi:MAG: 4-hydroxy-tetrahydrodipicolinate reductase [Betaproteobacteria bacterium]|nr:4-hydroxy-tetrahydrodipicolinate reductase [Betaproteobacteria bacterium]